MRQGASGNPTPRGTWRYYTPARKGGENPPGGRLASETAPGRPGCAGGDARAEAEFSRLSPGTAHPPRQGPAGSSGLEPQAYLPCRPDPSHREQFSCLPGHGRELVIVLSVIKSKFVQ